MAAQQDQSTGGSNTKGQSDDPRQAAESGEPQVAGRTHGRVVDENTQAGDAGGNPPEAQGEEKRNPSQDWESGRHDSMKGNS